jgi:hypothetical protein
MSISRMMRTSCTIIQRVPTGEVDRHGDAITEEVEVETRCALQQDRRTEHEEGGEVSDAFWRLFLPWGTEVGSGAAIMVDGREYELQGEPWSASEGSRSMWHVEAAVRRTAGTGEA